MITYKVTVPRVYIALISALLKYFASEESDGRLSQYHIGELRKYGCNPGLARPGLEWLTDNEILSISTELDEHDHYSIWQFTSEGAQYIDNLFDDQGELRPDQAGSTGSWQPLDLERADLEPAVAVVEELYERVRGDNELAEQEPVVQKTISESLRVGLDLLRKKLLTREQLRSLLVSPAVWLITNFGKGALGELAKQVVTIFMWKS